MKQLYFSLLLLTGFAYCSDNSYGAINSSGPELSRLNKVYLWAMGKRKFPITRNDIEESNLDLSRVFQLVEKASPVAPWVRSGFGASVVGAFIVSLTDSIETDIMQLIQLSGPPSPILLSALFVGLGVAIPSWIKAGINAFKRRKKESLLKKYLDSYNV